MAEMQASEGFEKEIEAAIEAALDRLAQGDEPSGPIDLQRAGGRPKAQRHHSAAISSRIQELASSEMEIRTSPAEGAGASGRRATPQPEADPQDGPELSWAYRQQLQQAKSRSSPFLAAALGAIAGSVATLLAVGAALSFLGVERPKVREADVVAVQAPAPAPVPSPAVPSPEAPPPAVEAAPAVVTPAVATPPPPPVEPKPPRRAAKQRDAEAMAAGGGVDADEGGRNGSPVDNLPETLSESEILRVVLLHKPEIVACVADHGDEPAPGTKRTLTMRWTIERDGRTSGVAVASAGLASSPVGACLADEIATWRFPRHREPQPPIRFPFTY